LASERLEEKQAHSLLYFSLPMGPLRKRKLLSSFSFGRNIQAIFLLLKLEKPIYLPSGKPCVPGKQVCPEKQAYLPSLYSGKAISAVLRKSKPILPLLSPTVPLALYNSSSFILPYQPVLNLSGATYNIGPAKPKFHS